MTAIPLFEQQPVGRARRNDPETSKRAARKVNPAANRQRILECLSFYGAQNDRQLCERLAPDEPLRWQSIISARSGLKKEGAVEAHGEFEDRIVWRLTSAFRRTAAVEVQGGRL